MSFNSLFVVFFGQLFSYSWFVNKWNKLSSKWIHYLDKLKRLEENCICDKKLIVIGQAFLFYNHLTSTNVL